MTTTATTTRAQILARVTTSYRDVTPKARLARALDLHRLWKDEGMSYAAIVKDVTTRDALTTISTKSISLHLAALKQTGLVTTPEAYVTVYRALHSKSRGSEKTATETPKADVTTDGEKKEARPGKKDAVTPGNDASVKTRDDALKVIAALTRIVTTWDDEDRDAVAEALLEAAESLSLAIGEHVAA